MASRLMKIAKQCGYGVWPQGVRHHPAPALESRLQPVCGRNRLKPGLLMRCLDWNFKVPAWSGACLPRRPHTAKKAWSG